MAHATDPRETLRTGLPFPDDDDEPPQAPYSTMRSRLRERVLSPLLALVSFGLTASFGIGLFLMLREFVDDEFGRGDLVDAAGVLLAGHFIFRSLFEHALVRALHGGRSLFLDGDFERPEHRVGSAVVEAGDFLSVAGWAPDRPLPVRLRTRRSLVGYAAAVLLGLTAIIMQGEVLHAFAGAVGFGYIAAADRVATLSRQTVLRTLQSVLRPLTLLAIVVFESFWPLTVGVAVLMPAALIVRHRAIRRWFLAESPRLIGAISLRDRPYERSRYEEQIASLRGLSLLPFTLPPSVRLIEKIIDSLRIATYSAAMLIAILRGRDLFGLTFDPTWAFVFVFTFAIGNSISERARQARSDIVTMRPLRGLFTDPWRRRYAAASCLYGLLLILPFGWLFFPRVGDETIAWALSGTIFAVLLAIRVLCADERTWQAVVAPRLEDEVTDDGDDETEAAQPAAASQTPRREAEMKSFRLARDVKDPSAASRMIDGGVSLDRPIRLGRHRIAALTKRRLLIGICLLAVEVCTWLYAGLPGARWRVPPVLSAIGALFLCIVPSVLLAVLRMQRGAAATEPLREWLLRGGWTATYAERTPRLLIHREILFVAAATLLSANLYFRAGLTSAVVVAAFATILQTRTTLQNARAAFPASTLLGTFVRWHFVLLTWTAVLFAVSEWAVWQPLVGFLLGVPIIGALCSRLMMRYALRTDLHDELAPPDTISRHRQIARQLGFPFDRLPHVVDRRSNRMLHARVFVYWTLIGVAVQYGYAVAHRNNLASDYMLALIGSTSLAAVLIGFVHTAASLSDPEQVMKASAKDGLRRGRGPVLILMVIVNVAFVALIELTPAPAVMTSLFAGFVVLAVALFRMIRDDETMAITGKRSPQSLPTA